MCKKPFYFTSVRNDVTPFLGYMSLGFLFWEPANEQSNVLTFDGTVALLVLHFQKLSIILCATFVNDLCFIFSTITKALIKCYLGTRLLA